MVIPDNKGYGFLRQLHAVLSEVKYCTSCPLAGEAYANSRIVRGKGSKVMFVGEAPGREEAEQHQAFVGASGKMLDRWVKHIGTENYIITNAVRHRPTEGNRNRPPTELEVIKCLKYLEKEIHDEEPDFIITLGRVAINSVAQLMDTPPFVYSTDMFKARPLEEIIELLWHSEYYIYLPNKRIRVLALYHPAYVKRKGIDMKRSLDRLKTLIVGNGI